MIPVLIGPLALAALLFDAAFRFRRVRIFPIELSWPVGERISGFWIREFMVTIGDLFHYHVMVSDIGSNTQKCRNRRFSSFIVRR